MLSCVEIMVSQSFLFFGSYDVRDGFLISVYSTLHLFQLNPKNTLFGVIDWARL